MIRKRTIFALVTLVFVAGAVSGYFLGMLSQKASSPEPEQAVKREQADPAPSTEDRLMSWMVGYLELSDNQESEIRPLVRLAIQEHHQLEMEQIARIDALIFNSDLRIAKHLSESQAQKLFEYNRIRRERRDAYLAEEEARRAAASVSSSSD